MDHASVRLLRERFDLDDGEAEHILGSFVEAVERNLEEYGICHVAGIGSFVRAPGDSRTSFESAEALDRAVNARFADLPVYEIGTERAPDRPAAMSGTGPASEPEMSDPTLEGVATTPGAAGKGVSDAVMPAAPEAVESTASQTRPHGDESDDESADARAAHAAETVEEDEPASPSLAAGRSPRRRHKESSGGVRAAWIALPLLVVAAVAAVWFMQRPAGQQPEAESMANQSEPTAQTPAGGAGVESASRDRASAEGGETTDPSAEAVSGERPAPDTDTTTEQAVPGERQTAAEAEAEAEAERTPPTGRDAQTGAGDEDAAQEASLDRTVDGYTMIVGSSPDRTAADEQISRFTELDLPFGVLDYSEDGSPMYRLAVGLFDSAEQADSARQAMADTLPSGTWVWRIR